MSVLLPVPRGAARAKPAYGQPCNQCGLCCQATICPLGQHVFRRTIGPCPALQRDEGNPAKYVCGLAVYPALYRIQLVLLHSWERMSKAALHLIGAGEGCDARINGEPIDHEFRRKLLEVERRKRRQTNDARKLWGVPKS